MLVDHPDASDFADLSAANADLLGFRPFLSLYAAESILEVRYGLVRGVRALTRVSRTVATMLDQPTSGDTISMGPQLWTVGRITTIAPQGTPIIYKAEVS